MASVLLGWGAWLSASRLRIPAPALLGPMLIVGTATVLGFTHPEFPSWTKTALQIVVGAFLGYNVDRNAVLCIRSMLKPIGIATAWMITSALAIGYLLALFTHIDLMTAFLATSPGGMAEMSAMAMTSRANVALVATLQSFRIVTTTLAIPFLARGIAGDATPSRASMRPLPGQGQPPRATSSRFAWLVWLGLALAGAALFGWLQISAAGILGPMIAVGLTRASGVSAPRPPILLRTTAQIGLGVLIGSTFDSHTVQLLRDESGIVLLVTAGTVISALGLAGLVQRLLRTDRRTALLACAPGGLTQMGIVADELGAQVFVVNMFQLARLICAVLILPFVMRLIT